MNSLTYLSRQFDVLASAKTPPSTPTLESSSYLSDSEKYSHSNYDSSSPGPPLKRIKTWSAKSFLFPPVSTRPRPAHRSASSPAGLAASPALHKTIAASVVAETSIRPRAHLESTLRRVFLIRVFVLLWETLRSFWVSVAGGRSLQKTREEVAVDSGLTTEESDDETKVDQHVPIPEIYPPSSELLIPSSPSTSPSLPHIHRSVTDPTTTQGKLEVIQASPISATVLVAAPQSTDRHIATSTTTPPLPNSRRTPFHFPKTLVLDLDETLIHSTSRPLFASGGGGTSVFGLGSFGRRNKGAGHMVEVVLGGRSTLYHVYKRPFVDFFLRTVSGWYTLVIFTASMQEYADPVIDWLDAGRGILSRRLFRDSCTQLPNGSYTKDLSVVEEDLARVCLIDNSPISYRVNEANGIPIEGWTHDPSDEALLDLLPVLDSLRFTSDVRKVLGIRGFS